MLLNDTFRFISENIIQEMHLIAYYYHWSRETIRNLTARERKQWVDLIIEHTNHINGADEGG